jgi:hypothetical protein
MAIAAEVAGVYSLGLIMHRLPADKMPARGVKVRLTGKFHGLITPTTPNGWYSTQDLAPNNAKIPGCDFTLVFLHPVFEVLLGMSQWPNRGCDVGKHRLVFAAMAKIFVHCLNKGFLVFFYCLYRSLQAVNTRRGTDDALGKIGLTLAV